jgi:hypothetical protein
MDKIYYVNGDNGKSAPNFEERRAHPRRDVRVNKVFSADVEIDGEMHPCRLYVADASGGGFKITTDFSFPMNVPLKMTMHLKVPFSFVADVPWARDLGAGMQAIGIRFLEIDEENKTILDDFIDYYTSKETSKVYRLNKVIPMRIKHSEEADEPSYVLTLEISLVGLKIIHEERLPEDRTIEMKLHLDPHSGPLEVKARVLSQKEEGSFSERYIVNLEFVEMESETREFLSNFIDSAKTGIIEKKISRPVVIFDEDSAV